MHVYIDSHISTDTLNELKMLLERNIMDMDNPQGRQCVHEDLIYRVFRSILKNNRSKAIRDIGETSPELLCRLNMIADDINEILSGILDIDHPFKHYNLKSIELNDILIKMIIEEN